MARSSYVWMAVATCFVLVLLYATLRSTPTPLGQSSDDRLAAVRECQSAVREDVADARFPTSPNVTDLGEGRLLLSGSVDSGSETQTVRRNYECYLSPDSSAGAYEADSVEVWQSH